jgi:hypothetical protein
VVAESGRNPGSGRDPGSGFGPGPGLGSGTGPAGSERLGFASGIET